MRKPGPDRSFYPLLNEMPNLARMQEYIFFLQCSSSTLTFLHVSLLPLDVSVCCVFLHTLKRAIVGRTALTFEDGEKKHTSTWNLVFIKNRFINNLIFNNFAFAISITC